MVVPDHGKRELRVDRLQVGIQLVERVAQPVGAQVHRFFSESLGHRDAAPGRPDRVLVGVVAEVQDEVEVPLQHVAVCGVVAARPVLARHEGEAELTHHLVPRGGGAEVADGALLAAHAELIEVVASRAQAVDLDVHGMRQLGRCDGHAVGHDVAQAAVGPDAPAHGHRPLAEAPGLGRLGCQARPQHDAVGRGIARGHAQREGIRPEPRRRERVVPGHQGEGQAGPHAVPRVVKKPTSIDRRHLCLAMAHEPSLFRGGRDCDRGEGRLPARRSGDVPMDSRLLPVAIRGGEGGRSERRRRLGTEMQHKKADTPPSSQVAARPSPGPASLSCATCACPWGRTARPREEAMRRDRRIVANVLLGGALVACAAHGMRQAHAQSTTLVINEIDYDQPSIDTAEFIELRNVSGAPISLDPYALVLVNAAATGGPAPYRTIDLPAVDLTAGEHYVVCGNSANVANCDLDLGIATGHGPERRARRHRLAAGRRLRRQCQLRRQHGRVYRRERRRSDRSCCWYSEHLALPRRRGLRSEQRGFQRAEPARPAKPTPAPATSRPRSRAPFPPAARRASRRAPTSP